jgi:hypothetical protein
MIETANNNQQKRARDPTQDLEVEDNLSEMMKLKDEMQLLLNVIASMKQEMEEVKQIAWSQENKINSLTQVMDEKLKTQITLEEKVIQLTSIVESQHKELTELKNMNVKQTTKVLEKPKSFKDAAKAAVKLDLPPVPASMIEEKWTEVKSKVKVQSIVKPTQVQSSMKSSLKTFLDASPSKEEVLKTLLKSPKKPEERESNIISIFAKAPLTSKGMLEPILSWKQILSHTTGELPLSISIVSPNMVELFYEEKSLHKVIPILKANGHLMERTSAMMTEKDIVRRTEAYLRGYFLPLRRAALIGFNPELQKKVLSIAKEKVEKKFVDKFTRQQWRHQIQKDMDHIMQVESAQMDI